MRRSEGDLLTQALGLESVKLDPCRVGAVFAMVRGRRAQKTRPCPRLLNENPFGVKDFSELDALRVQPQMWGMLS